MNTVQSNVGRGSFARTLKQTAEKAPNSSLSPDNRQYVNPANGELAEVWKPLPDFETRYAISNTGRVMSLPDGKPVKLRYMKKGGAILSIKTATKRNHYVYLKRQIALTFLPNPNGYQWVKYKDGNNQRNDVSNLEWIPAYNQRFKKAFQVPDQVPDLSTVSTLPYVEQVLDRLLSEGKLIETERKRAEVIPAIEDCMAPLFSASARLVVVPVDRADYEQVTGVVAVVVKAQRFVYYLGRVKSITSDDITVSRDNSLWSERTESRMKIAGLARVVWVIENTVY